LTTLRAVDATETDTFRASVVQDFDGVSVEDGDDLDGEPLVNLGGDSGPNFRR
jgi:hypothetical protein